MRGDPVMDQQIVRAVGEKLGALAKSTERELSIMLDMEQHAFHKTPMVTSQPSIPQSPLMLKSIPCVFWGWSKGHHCEKEVKVRKLVLRRLPWMPPIDKEKKKRIEEPGVTRNSR